MRARRWPPSRRAIRLAWAILFGLGGVVALGSTVASTLDIVLLLAGFVLLLGGAEFLVRGAATLAKRVGVNSLVIGLTVVAFGTSAPELFIGLMAVFEGKSDFNVGNVVGSNIANIGLILGATALTLPFVVSRQALRHDIPIMIVATGLSIAAFWDGRIQRWEGVVGLLLLLGYLTRSWRLAKTGVVEPEEVETISAKSRMLAIVTPPALILGGLLALVGGGALLIRSGASIAEQFGVPEVVIGLTVYAFGTSLPELATCVVAAIRNEPEIVIGNVVGSNLFNLLFVLGVTSVISPITIPVATTSIDMWVMLGFAVAMPLVSILGHRITRIEGGLLVAAYVAYVIVLFAI